MWIPGPFRFLARRRRSDADFKAEIAAHLALEVDRLVGEGHAPAEAAALARRRFGNVGQAREAFHRRRTIGWLEELPLALRRAGRRLARAPVFSFTAILTLALGIGATTAVFSLAVGILLRPLPFAEPDRLVDVSHSLVLRGISQVDQSDATYLYYQTASHSFSGIGLYRTDVVNLGLGAAGDSAAVVRADATRATASAFSVLGLTPLRGRLLRPAEDLPGARVAILSERLWRRSYGSDLGIIGRTVTIDGVAHEVIGVLPEQVAFPDEKTDLWLSIGIDPARTRSAAFDYKGVARLRTGATVASATADLTALLPHVPEAYPGRLTAASIRLIQMRPVVRPLRDTVVGGVRPALTVVFAAGLFLLLLASANVANLFLARVEERQHDLAVRRALGGGRAVILAQFLPEALLLAAAGGALGVLLARVGLGALRILADGTIPRLEGVGIDGTVLAAAAGITVLTALGMSVIPALRSAPPIAGVLGQTSRAASAGRSRHRARRALVVVQVAVALLLVTGAGLMARTFHALRSVPLGFDQARSYAFRVALPAAAYPTAASGVSFVSRALETVGSLPGVQAVGVLSKLPLDDEARSDTAVFVEDRPLGMGEMPNVHQVAYVTPATFAALGIPLVEGRPFEVPDPAKAPLEVIVTRALAHRYWGPGPAVGKRLKVAPIGPWFTVVGVTGDVRGTRVDQPPDETVYLPFVTAPGPAADDGGASAARWTPHNLAFVVRTAADLRTVAVPVERALRAIAPDLPLYGVRPMADVVARSTARTSFTLNLLEIASIASLLIGAVGLYGVVAYMVSLRTREMAIRVALGAAPAALQRRVLVEALMVTGVGVVVGLGAALLLTPFLSALLYQVAPTDPLTLIGAATTLLGVAVLASWIPARRAAATAPAAVLRVDG